MGVGVEMHRAQWDAAYSSQGAEDPLNDLHKSTGELSRCHLWVIPSAVTPWKEIKMSHFLLTLLCNLWLSNEA